MFIVHSAVTVVDAEDGAVARARVAALGGVARA